MKQVTTRAGQMRRMFADWNCSGLSLRAFGKREGVSYAKLLYWRRKFQDADSVAQPAIGSHGFAPVRVVPDATPDLAGAAKTDVISVWLANGVSLEVPLGVDEGELGRLVRVLSAC